ncbi:MAG: lysylphosphatidylglycerol synthase transmembrane domain-containing protein [Cyanobacteriota bacterium]
MSRRWLLALIAALMLYLILGLCIGLQGVGARLAGLSWWWWPLAPITVSAGYSLLLMRWQLYLRTLKAPLSLREGARIYGAGLALIAAPGRSGEALRGLWLRRRHGFPLAVGVSITLAERLADLAAALLLLGWGLGSRLLPFLLLAALIGAGTAWLVSHPLTLRHLDQSLERLPLTRPWHGLTRLLRAGLASLAQLRTLLHPRPLLIGTLLASLCWLLESWLLQGLLNGLQAPISLQQATVVRTAMALGGVLSILPAGLGTSEATAIGLAIGFGVARPAALAATLILRLATVAYPALVGSVLLSRQRDLGHRDRALPKQAAGP